MLSIQPIWIKKLDNKLSKFKQELTKENKTIIFTTEKTKLCQIIGPYYTKF